MRWLISTAVMALGWLRLLTGWLRSKAELVRQASELPDLYRRLIIAEQDTDRAVQRADELQAQLRVAELELTGMVRAFESLNALLRENIALNTYRAARRSRREE